MSKSFFERGQAYLEKQKLEFLRSVVSTELEPVAVEYAIEEGWIMPNEGLEHATVDAIFKGNQLHELSQSVKIGAIDEREGSKRVAASVAAMLGNIMTILKARGAKDGIKMTHSRPPSASPTSEPDIVTGIPECRGKNTVVLYGFNIGGKDVLAFKGDAEAMLNAVDKRKQVTLTCHQSRWWCVAEDVQIMD